MSDCLQGRHNTCSTADCQCCTNGHGLNNLGEPVPWELPVTPMTTSRGPECTCLWGGRAPDCPIPQHLQEYEALGREYEALGDSGVMDTAVWSSFSGVVSVCHCADMEPHVPRRRNPPMTADLTPAQAARLEAIEAAPYAEEACVERVARALWEACDGEGSGLPGDDKRVSEPYRQRYRRYAVAAIDVMRGAADDGAIGRVLALADELLRVAQDSDGITATVYRQNADRIIAAIGAPATVEGGGDRA